LPFIRNQNTSGATLETNEPNYLCGWQNATSVWYKFLPSSNGLYSIDTSDSGYDTLLHVYEQPSGGDLNAVVCNDDVSNTLNSKIIFNAQAGKIYYIAVTAYGGGLGGDLILNLNQITCPTGSLCGTVISGTGYAAYYPSVRVLDSEGNYIAYDYGDEFGYIEIPNLSSETYTLVAASYGNFLVDNDVRGPGLFSIDGKGLPTIDVVAKDKSGTLIDASIYISFSYYGFGYAGSTSMDSPNYIYITPGIFDITIVGWDDGYILSKEGTSVNVTSANMDMPTAQTIVMDASQMPINTFNLNWDGFSEGYFNLRPADARVWYWLNVTDGQSVVVSVPREDFGFEVVPYLEDIDTGDVWEYSFNQCCFNSVTDDSTTTLTAGGALTPYLYAYNDPYAPGETGALYTNVWDSYDNWLTEIWQWDDSATSSIFMSESGENGDLQVRGSSIEQSEDRFIALENSYPQGSYVEIVPEYQVKDPLGNIVDGNLSWYNFIGNYEFVILNPTTLGSWQGQVTVDFGPYQTYGRDTINFDVVAPPTNDDFDTPTEINTIPYNGTLNTGGSSEADDDPEITNCGLNAGIATVWFQFTAPTNGEFLIDTRGSDYDTILAVWTGSRGNLSPVACNDDIGGDPWDTDSQLAIRVITGTVYYIEVAEFDGYHSTSSIDINQELKPVRNDTGIQSGGVLEFQVNEKFSVYIPLVIR